ncbi:hypothetical protein CMT37_05145 [Elizabethkingia anophelis]|nr:hypothetical protein [Elizabethkingia anophelis]
MNIKNILLQGISIASVAVCFFGLTSCRTTDTENNNNLTEGTKAQVNINFMGTAFKDGGLDPQASLKSAGISGNAGKEQSKSVMITPSTVMVTTLSPVKSNSSAQAGLKNTLAAVAGNPLGNGIKFRVIAYKSSGGAYQTYQDYTTGEAAPPMTLDTGVAYNIVAYSYGTTSLPTITPEETSNISNAQISFDNAHKDLMYVKQSYTPSSTNTNLPITLMHQLMQITTSVTTNIGDINSIANAALTPNFSNGVFSLNTGVMSGRTTQANQNIDFSANNFPVAVNTPANAGPVLINANTTGGTASFAADISIGATAAKTVTLRGFDITPGMQANLNVGVFKCGAWMDAAHTQWRPFMCQNLGAAQGIDPFSPEAGNHGAKYQWGYKPANPNVSDNRYLTSNDDQLYTGTPPTGWTNTTMPDDAWNANPGGGANNPCPAGYRVPTTAEWNAVLNNNTIERTTASWANSATNFGSALYVKDPVSNKRTLMLPSAGNRYNLNGTLSHRGDTGIYWTSTWGFNSGTPIADDLEFDATTAVVNRWYTRAMGYSVRCITE